MHTHTGILSKSSYVGNQLFAMLATSCLALEWSYGAFIIETLCHSKVLNQCIPTKLSGAHILLRGSRLSGNLIGPQKGQVTSSS